MVVQVGVQLGEENVAVTPVGSAEVENDVLPAVPDCNVTVRLSAMAPPCATEIAEEAAETV